MLSVDPSAPLGARQFLAIIDTLRRAVCGNPRGDDF
jgi:hypothetical protein